jgi:hypothetical protein
MADAQDLKSWDRKKSCGFESHHRHHCFEAVEHPEVTPSTTLIFTPAGLRKLFAAAPALLVCLGWYLEASRAAQR